MEAKDVTRFVLPDIERVGFYGAAGSKRCPEDITFAACLRTVLDSLGDDDLCCRQQTGCDSQPCRWRQMGCLRLPLTTCGYGLITCLTGQAFQTLWNAHQPEMWGGAVMRTGADPLRALRWALEGLGYDYEVIGNDTLDQGCLFHLHGGREALLAHIQDSLQAGRPVIAFGLVGPDMENALITGYDEGGEVLIGWSFFQEMAPFNEGLTFEPDGRFRKRGWYDSTLGLVIVKEKRLHPSLEELYRGILQHGLEVLRTEESPDPHCASLPSAAGTAAFDAWAESLQCEGSFPAADLEKLREFLNIHNDAVGSLAELRSAAVTVLRDAAKLFPEAADELNRAAGCFTAQHDLMWNVWEALGVDGWPLEEGPPPEEALRLARCETRMRIVEVLRRAQQRDSEAAKHIETALTKLARKGPARAGRLAARKAPHVQRAVLENAPYVGYDSSRLGGEPEETAFCAAMRAALACLGEPTSYTFLMGVSGAAFRLSWNGQTWDRRSQSTFYMGADPSEPMRRAFTAVGWEPEIAANTAWQPGEADLSLEALGLRAQAKTEEELRWMVYENIRAKHYPLISLGVFRPPECGLVSGFDAGGDVLIGWHHDQDQPENDPRRVLPDEPDGQYRKRGWLPDTVGLIGFHYKTYKPPFKDSLARALEWAVKLARTVGFRGRKVGAGGLRGLGGGLAARSGV